MPSFLSIASGESVGTFTIRTASFVFGVQTATITARADDIVKTVTLTVNP